MRNNNSNLKRMAWTASVVLSGSVITYSAAGITWGTPEAGAFVGMSLFIAALAAVMSAALS